MSTATQHQTQTVTREAEGLLEQAIEKTQRVQSIRNTAAQFLGVPPDRVCDLLRNVWRTSKDQPALTDAEMFMGMSMIARFGLDPISKEVYVTRSSKGLMTVMGIDGWIKVLNRVEDYDGFEQSEEWDAAGNLSCVETRIYTTKRARPTTYRGYAKEYQRMAGVVAEKMPWHMLRIFSLRHAARLFTPIGGSVVTEEEARWMDAYASTPEEDRTRKNTLKDKVAAAASSAKEFEPIPQPAPEPAPEPTPEPTPQPTPQPAPEPVKLDSKPIIVEADVVMKYRDLIEGCTSLLTATKLVVLADSDPLIGGCKQPTVAFIHELLQGNVSKWRQQKTEATDSATAAKAASANRPR